MNINKTYGPALIGLFISVNLIACHKADVVFTRGSLNEAEIFTMNADGSDITQITDDSTIDTEPVWGPESNIIIFESIRGGRHNMGIFSLNLSDGTVTEIIDTPLRDSYPAISPNGKKVVFASDVTPEFDRTGPAMEIFTVNMDGTNLTRLTHANGVDHDPHWSPDGSKIVFVSERDSVDAINANKEIYVMNADGSSQTRLTFEIGQEIDPHWSPDGSKIAFSSNRDGGPEIYIMNADGSGVFQVTVTEPDTMNVSPTWSPDATQLIFSKEILSSNIDNLYRINADGTALTQLTSDSLSDRNPDWRH